MESKLRNIIVKIAKGCIENNVPPSQRFTKVNLQELFFLRKFEMYLLFPQDFDSSGSFIFEAFVIDQVEDVIKKHNKIKNMTQIEEAKTKFHKYYNSIKENYDFTIEYDKYFKNIELLHWCYLPIYTDYLVKNRRVAPEVNPQIFYSHFHSLKYLFQFIENKESWKSIKGDINLDIDLSFKIYNERWHGEDTYKIKRLYNGWNVNFMNMGGYSTPDGEYGDSRKYEFVYSEPTDEELEDTLSGFKLNFRQDFIEAPERFFSLLEQLWKMADDNPMSVEELQIKLNDLAFFLSSVQKTIENATPSWYK